MKFYFYERTHTGRQKKYWLPARCGVRFVYRTRNRSPKEMPELWQTFWICDVSISRQFRCSHTISGIFNWIILENKHRFIFIKIQWTTYAHIKSAFTAFHVTVSVYTFVNILPFCNQVHRILHVTIDFPVMNRII